MCSRHDEAVLKAVVVSGFGGPEQLRLAEVADPVPGPGQVRMAVHAAGVNPMDAGPATGPMAHGPG
jgi:NADPH:quinone reductase-like Zn-dependent oxidoreductase